MQHRKNVMMIVSLVVAFGTMVVPSVVAQEPRPSTGSFCDLTVAVSNDVHVDSKWAVQTGRAASDLVLTHIGDAVQRGEPTADLRVALKDTTPYLAEQVDGQAVWLVRVPGVIFRVGDGDGALTKLHDLEAVVLARTGELVRLASRWPVDLPTLWPPPESDYAAWQLRYSGGERWEGFATGKPAHTLAEALRTIESSMGHVAIAPQIIAHRLRWSSQAFTPSREVWSVELRGAKELGEYGIHRRKSQSPEVERNMQHIRHIVSMLDNKWLRAGIKPAAPNPALPIPKDLQRERDEKDRVKQEETIPQSDPKK